MKAILIGSRAYKETDYGDTDILCDREWKDAWDKTYGSLAEPRVDGRYDSETAKYETCEGIYEVIVPPEGGAHWELLQVSDNFPDYKPEPYDTTQSCNGVALCAHSWLPEGLTLKRTPLVFLAALKKAHLILPSSSPEKWRRQIEEYVALKALLKESLDEHIWVGDAVGVFDGPVWHPTHYASMIYKMHRQECLARQKKPPKLNQDKKAFFGDEPYEIFDHDSIHEALSYPSTPAYTQMKDGEVMCSRKKWDAMTESEKLRCVVEEAGILALERSILPALFLDRGYRDQRWAYETALMKIGTTITSGFFRDYAIEVWEQAKDAMPDLAGRFFEGVKAGIVKRKKLNKQMEKFQTALRAWLDETAKSQEGPEHAH